MAYNRDAGYPPDWIHLSNLQDGLNRKLAGRGLDREKIAKNQGCGPDPHNRWAWQYGSLLWGLPASRIEEIGAWIGLPGQVFAAEVLLGIGSEDNCAGIWGEHLWVPITPGGDPRKGYRIPICAYPKDEIEKMIDAIEECALPHSSGCFVTLEIPPHAHKMQPGGGGGGAPPGRGGTPSTKTVTFWTVPSGASVRVVEV